MSKPKRTSRKKIDVDWSDMREELQEKYKTDTAARTNLTEFKPKRQKKPPKFKPSVPEVSSFEELSKYLKQEGECLLLDPEYSYRSVHYKGTRRTLRYVAALLRGEPVIHKGMQVRTTCGRKDCVSEAHLRVIRDRVDRAFWYKDKFMAKVEQDSGVNGECWTWRSKYFRKYTAYFGLRLKHFSYILKTGENVPRGSSVIRVLECPTVGCFAPHHLKLGTVREAAKYKRLRALSTKLSLASAKEIRDKSFMGVSEKELAKEYGVSVKAIKDVLDYRTWNKK